jgi:hypothetical protein
LVILAIQFLGFSVQVFTEEKQNVGFSRQDLRRMEYLAGTTGIGPKIMNKWVDGP